MRGTQIIEKGSQKLTVRSQLLQSSMSSYLPPTHVPTIVTHSNQVLDRDQTKNHLILDFEHQELHAKQTSFLYKVVCGGWEAKCPAQAQVFGHLVLIGSTAQGSYGTFRRCGLKECIPGGSSENPQTCLPSCLLLLCSLLVVVEDVIPQFPVPGACCSASPPIMNSPSGTTNQTKPFLSYVPFSHGVLLQHGKHVLANIFAQRVLPQKYKTD